MPMYKAKEIRDSVINKLQGELRSGREDNFWYYYESKKTLRVTLPKGRVDLKPGTLKSIRNQLLLDKKQFDDLVRCPMTGTDFDSLVREKVERGEL